MAAVLAVVVAAVGPFVHQIISFRYIQQSTGSAYIPIISVWGVPPDSDGSAIGDAMMQDVFSGLFARSDSGFDVTPITPVGNSTWSVYQTLALQSECRNTTDLLTLVTNCNISDNPSYPYQYQCSPTSDLLYFNWTLPGSVGFNVTTESEEGGGPVHNLSATLPQSLVFQDKGLVFADVAIIYGFINQTEFGVGDPPVSMSFADANALAIEYILQVVGETLNASFTYFGASVTLALIAPQATRP